MSVDDKDKEILRIFMEDAKTSTKEISEKIDSPITTVYSRIKRLEDTGVIKGYKPVLERPNWGSLLRPSSLSPSRIVRLAWIRTLISVKLRGRWHDFLRFRRRILSLENGISLPS